MADRRKCPECGVTVKVENLPAHYEKLHPRAEVPEVLREESAKAVEVAQKEHRPRRATTASERRTYLIAAVVIVVIVVLGIAAQSLLGGLVGKQAPDFTLTNSADSTVVKPTSLGRVVLLDFMRTTCEFCQQFTQQTLVPLHNSANGSRFILISIDINVNGEDLATGNPRINTFKTSYGATWAYALDVTQKVTSAYGITGTPTHFIVDKTGKIVYEHSGVQTVADLTAELAKYW